VSLLIEGAELVNRQRVEIAHAHLRYRPKPHAGLLRVKPRDQSGNHQVVTAQYLERLRNNAAHALNLAEHAANGLINMWRVVPKPVTD